MQIMKLQTLVLIALLGSWMPTARAATLPAAEDSYGTRSKLTLAANKSSTLPVGATHRAYLYFNLADLPSAATIRYARLRLYLPRVVRAGSGLSVHQVTSSWDESLASAEPTFTATPLTNFTTGLGTKRFISVDVSSTVQAWLTTPTSNEGFAIAAIPGATAALTASVTLGAKEGAGSGYLAELEVEIATDPIAAGAIGTTQLATGAVQTGNIANGAVGSTQLASGLTLGGTTNGTFSGNGAGLTSLSTANLTGNITGTQIAAGTIQSTNIASGAIGAVQLASGLTLGGTTSGIFSGNGAALTNLNADLLDGLDSLAFAPASSSSVYLAKVGDTMTGPLVLPANGLTVGTNQIVVAGGNVGIGTSSTPSAKLEVNGSFALTGALRVPGAGVGTNGPAFVHVTAAGNVTSIINHPLCNGDPNAILIISHQAVGDLNTPSNLHNHPIGVNYYNGSWYIFNEDFAFMPAGMKFNVLVIKP